MPDLFSDLASKPQRETAGSDSASRFDYQKDWAFCQLMRKHIADESYLVAFEYHDDVLFLSPADHPTSADFIQVKTSSALGPRKLTSITTRPKGKPSILGKMLSNFDGICADHDVRVVLVSNNAFEFTDGELCAKDLSENFRKRLLEKLSDEMPDFDEARLDKLHFRVTGVSLEAMSSFLEGEASALFCHKFGEDHGLNIRTWIRLIQSEITRRNNYPSDKVHNLDELIEKKCIDKPLVEDTLKTINAKSKKSLDISLISSHLMNSGWALSDVMRLQKNLPEASKDFYNPLNRETQEISGAMSMNILDENNAPLELDDFLCKSVKQLMNSDNLANIYKNIDYLRALGTLVYYDEI
ncbi:MAG: dsDNA nuclease domain-containing protein [Pontimonas sp.]